MAVPDFQSLVLPVLRAAADGDTSAPELRSRVADDLRLTEADLAEMQPSGRQTTFAGLDGAGATKGIAFTTSAFRQGARGYVRRISKRIV